MGAAPTLERTTARAGRRFDCRGALAIGALRRARQRPAGIEGESDST